jgi:outer membrane immunogenic protein
MKRIAFLVALSILTESAALAADLPPVAPPPPPRAPAAYVPVAPPVYNWTGFYIGGNLGWGWSQGSFTDTFGNVISTTNTPSFLGGAQVGANYEFSNGFLIGAEADFDWAVNSNNGSTPAAGFTVTNNNRWFTLFDGRLGYAFDRWLVYGKGGFAWVGSGNTNVTNPAGITVATSSNNSNYGWNGGAGVEWAFWGNLSARLEYDYIRLNGATYANPLLAGDAFTGQNRNIQMINLGFNYKFGY